MQAAKQKRIDYTASPIVKNTIVKNDIKPIKKKEANSNGIFVEEDLQEC